MEKQSRCKLDSPGTAKYTDFVCKIIHGTACATLRTGPVSAAAESVPSTGSFGTSCAAAGILCVQEVTKDGPGMLSKGSSNLSYFKSSLSEGRIKPTS